jgi:hypothetical protein
MERGFAERDTAGASAEAVKDTLQLALMAPVV